MSKISLLVKKNLKWIIASIALVLFIAIIRCVYKDSIISFDDFCYKHISLLISDRLTFFIKIITNLGSAFSLMLVTLLMLFIPKNKKYGIFTMINLAVIFLLNVVLKFIFARPRPLDINLIEELGYSFPSAHAMVSTAFYGFFIYLIWQLKISKKRKRLYSILLSLLIISICITRIYLGVHYASDVFGGALIAISYLVVFTSIASKYLTVKESK